MQLHITCGDPTGIGPEIVVRALHSLPLADMRPYVYGHRSLLEDVSAIYGLSLPAMEIVEPDGIRDPMASPGQAQVAYLEDAIKNVLLVPSESVLITAPICKKTAYQGGLEFPGHTEFLAERSGANRTAMMMAGPRLKVILATKHIPLRKIPEELDSDQLADLIVLTHKGLQEDFGIPRPRLAVAGLNPHAGESGAFGDEEREIIEPSIRKALRMIAKDWNYDLNSSAEVPGITGPHPPDTIFWRAANGDHDAVLAMYHDQGLIAAKVLDLHETVNVTLGLPFVRTSPDHGVAHDLARTGKALPNSFSAALRMGMSIWQNRKLLKS